MRRASNTFNLKTNEKSIYSTATEESYPRKLMAAIFAFNACDNFEWYVRKSLIKSRRYLNKVHSDSNELEYVNRCCDIFVLNHYIKSLTKSRYCTYPQCCYEMQAYLLDDLKGIILFIN